MWGVRLGPSCAGGEPGIVDVLVDVDASVLARIRVSECPEVDPPQLSRRAKGPPAACDGNSVQLVGRDLLE